MESLFDAYAGLSADRAVFAQTFRSPAPLASVPLQKDSPPPAPAPPPQSVDSATAPLFARRPVRPRPSHPLQMDAASSTPRIRGSCSIERRVGASAVHSASLCSDFSPAPD